MGDSLIEPERDYRGSRWPAPLWFGVGLSAVWLIVLVTYATSADEKGATHWHRFWHDNPDAFGNAMAGAFAPLAFLWLIVGVFVQKEQLLQQLTEFQHSLDQQLLQNNLLAEQVERARAHDMARAVRIDLKAFLSDLVQKVDQVKIAYSRGDVRFGSRDELESHVRTNGHSLFGQRDEILRHVNVDRLQEAFQHIRESVEVHRRTMERDGTVPVIADEFNIYVQVFSQELDRILRRVKGISDAELSSTLRSLHLFELRNALLTVDKYTAERYARVSI